MLQLSQVGRIRIYLPLRAGPLVKVSYPHLPHCSELWPLSLLLSFSTKEVLATALGEHSGSHPRGRQPANGVKVEPGRQLYGALTQSPRQQSTGRPA